MPVMSSILPDVLPLSRPARVSLHLGIAVLQGIGLPLEEAMKFWRAEFGPKCAGEVSR